MKPAEPRPEKSGNSESPWLTGFDRLVLGHARLVVAALFVVTAFLGYKIRDFRIDASADSLVLEHDEDLRYYNLVNERYGTGDFLLVAYMPHGDLLAPDTLADLHRLRDALRALDRVTSVVSLLDVPLLRNPPVPLKELKGNMKTLESPGVDLELARAELRDSPLYTELIVSPDMRTTALQVNLEPDEDYARLSRRRTELRDRLRAGTLTAEERLELRRVTADYRAHKDLVDRRRHEDIRAVRRVLQAHQAHADVTLGGVSMIADDMISFIRRDLRVFGIGMAAFLVLTLAVIFRRGRWVALPAVCCLLSTVTMMGGLALFGWDVTVISSNFISLQLVVTMALTVHLIVRYRELQVENPELPHRERIRETVRTIFKPCLYTSTTTVAGFCSLIVCDILPVINFGWMMTLGLLVSLTVVFLAFPAILLITRAPTLPRKSGRPFAVTAFLARFTHRRPAVIFLSTALVCLLTVVGITRLEVENSFINYFKPSTEIYRGMYRIDRELGGTTPLDVLIDFEAAPRPVPAAPAAGADEFGDFAEFDAAGEAGKYWFTPERIADIRAVHTYLDSLPEVGKVLSVQTLLDVAGQFEGRRDWDSFELAILFNSFPREFRAMVLDPYVSTDHNQARVAIRIRDSLPGLRRAAFLAKISDELQRDGRLAHGRIRLAGMMVLYNNMLQSLYRSQIQTIGLTILLILAMFLVLFRSLWISLIAIFPNVISSLVVLGVMGLLGIPLDMMTITIVAISIGIAVDNTIHYIHRFRREFPKDHDYLQTMYRCHGSIGNAMYYTSITIIVGFSILALSDFIPSILFGLLTGLAMVISLLGSLTLLPRLILLFKPFGRRPETDAR